MDAIKRLYWRIPFAYREALEREPFDLIDQQNREILAGLDDPTYLRSSKMDPTMNSAETYIHQADEIIAMYRQGEFPRALAKASVESTRQLLARKTQFIRRALREEYLDDLLEAKQIVKRLNDDAHAHSEIYFLGERNLE